MYAVIRTGGKQQRVSPGDVIEVELVPGGPGDEVTFTPLLVVDDEGRTHFGREVARAVVRGRLLGEKKGEKVRVFKYRPKTGYARRAGHRQVYTLVEIVDVSLGRRAARARAGREEPAAETEAAGAAPAGSGDPDP
jgi:large subunit ribosomal protein L21